jgi:hypothetical protein
VTCFSCSRALFLPTFVCLTWVYRNYSDVYNDRSFPNRCRIPSPERSPARPSSNASSSNRVSPPALRAATPLLQSRISRHPILPTALFVPRAGVNRDLEAAPHVSRRVLPPASCAANSSPKRPCPNRHRISLRAFRPRPRQAVTAESASHHAQPLPLPEMFNPPRDEIRLKSSGHSQRVPMARRAHSAELLQHGDCTEDRRRASWGSRWEIVPPKGSVEHRLRLELTKRRFDWLGVSSKREDLGEGIHGTN